MLGTYGCLCSHAYSAPHTKYVSMITVIVPKIHTQSVPMVTPTHQIIQYI